MHGQLENELRGPISAQLFLRVRVRCTFPTAPLPSAASPAGSPAPPARKSHHLPGTGSYLSVDLLVRGASISTNRSAISRGVSRKRAGLCPGCHAHSRQRYPRPVTGRAAGWLAFLTEATGRCCIRGLAFSYVWAFGRACSTLRARHCSSPTPPRGGGGGLSGLISTLTRSAPTIISAGTTRTQTGILSGSSTISPTQFELRGDAPFKVCTRVLLVRFIHSPSYVSSVPLPLLHL